MADMDKLTQELAGLWEGNAKDVLKSLKKRLNKENKERLTGLSEKWAKANLKGDRYLIESYEVALSAFLAKHYRDVQDEFFERMTCLAEKSIPIIIKILAGFFGAAF